MGAVVVRELGGPEVLEWVEDVPVTLETGQLLVEVAVAGVNYIDTYHRTGLYPLSVPFTLGVEGAGTVVEIGTGVSGFAIGDRVAWFGGVGSYATHAAVAAEVAARIPDDVEFEVAAAVLLQGITAHFLAVDTWPLQPGDKCLIHAGAGGVGGLLIQIAKHRGAEVFATAGGPEKAALVEASGADHTIDYLNEDFVAAVEAIAGPRPLDVVYDGVGAATVHRGLALLRPRGLMASFGNASGPVEPIAPLELASNGSLYLTRPSSAAYLRTHEERVRRTDDLFNWLRAGTLTVRIGARFPLHEARAAHEALEGRATTGKVLLTV